ncbi:MAG: DEAD/DEAH box helicase [Casimicrobiaceae bacterium]
MNFSELALAPALLDAVAACGYTEPTAIQAQAIPSLLAGRDVIASAQTGTGKTAAFVLPALHRLVTQPIVGRRRPGTPRVLVLAPTRELAQQVADQAVSYARSSRINTVCLYGGAPYPVQNRQLSRQVDVLVATPGRLLDHVERGRVDLSAVELLVLDEADRMLDLGFADDVDRITAATPAGRQTVMFSATFDPAIARLANRLLRDPERIDATTAETPPLAIDQRVHFADNFAHKQRLLDHLLADVSVGQSIVFMATKRDAEALAVRLQEQGHAAAALHGDMTQRERTRTLQDMRRGGLRTLVATDVAALGIDVAGVTHVINFDLPRQADAYVHRIGRTGRAGATGTAVSLANHTERGTLRAIERFTGITIAPHVIVGLEPRGADKRPPARRDTRAGERQEPWRKPRPAGNGARPHAGGNERWGASTRDGGPWQGGARRRG